MLRYIILTGRGILLLTLSLDHYFFLLHWRTHTFQDGGGGVFHLTPRSMCTAMTDRGLQWLTFDVEVHGLADVSSHVIADLTQVVAAVLLQHVFDEQRAVDQHLDTEAWVQGYRLELGNPRTWGGRERKGGVDGGRGGRCFNNTLTLFMIKLREIIT